MNIFILDDDPAKSAKLHTNKHVVKMVLETAQMLCTANHAYSTPAPYKATHANHPCVKWVCASKANYRYAKSVGLALASEYSHRYKKVHKSGQVISALQEPDNLPDKPFTPPPRCMPDKYFIGDGSDMDSVVESYLNYYLEEKVL